MSIFYFLIIGLLLGFIVGLFYGRLLALRQRRRMTECIRLARTLQSC